MNIICNSLFMLNLSFVLIKEYKILQSQHYEISKYFSYIKNNRRKYYYFLYFLLGLFLLKIDLLYIFLNIILLIYLIRNYDTKDRIKITPRIKRIFIINFILITIMLIIDILKYVFILPFLYLLLVHFISLLVEKIVFLKFVRKAKKKIKGKTIIGITGSCGKTSVKNILYDLMISNYNVNKTPKSYNTRMGITKSINEYISKYDEYFICEYGVDKVKGMDKLLKVVKPNIGVITEITNQHLLSFKSIENILNEKIKIITSLDSDGIGIINNDNKYLREYDYKNRTILRYGIDNSSDVMAKNILLKIDGSSFDLYIKNKKISRIEISLLSRHSIENVLCAICVCLAINMSIEDILKSIKNINSIEHRLEPKVIDNIQIIDDSFNSNIKGFLDALEILNLSSKYKIIITPGIIEQGENNKKVSYLIAEKIINYCDYVYLVTDNTKYIKDYFDNNNFKKYECHYSFNSAFIEAKKIDYPKIILIENDLPNIYLK